MPSSKVMKTTRKAAKPKHSLKNTMQVNKKASNLPPRPSTPLSQVNAGLSELPTTPISQMIPSPITPMAPGRSRKRRLSEADAEEVIDLDTSPGRLLELVTPTQSFQSHPSTNLAPTKPERPQSMLSKQGLAVTSSTVSSARSAKRVKRTVSDSQALVQQTESDPTMRAHLSSLIDTGRRAGGSPTYTFTRGNSRIRYEYKADQDKGGESVADEPRRKRDVGTTLSVKDQFGIRSLYFKQSHIPESIDFEI